MTCDALDTTREITKLFKKSPKRVSHLEKLQKEMAEDDTKKQGIRLLCPTKWTVCAQDMESIVENYEVLGKLWAGR